MTIDQFVIIFMFPIINSNTATTTTTVDRSAVAAAEAAAEAEAMDADCISRKAVSIQRMSNGEFDQR